MRTDLTLSQRAGEMLSRLQDLTRGWAVRFRQREVLQLLADLGRTGEPLVTLFLHPFAYSRAPFVSQAAGSAIRELLEEVPPQALVALDELARGDLFRMGSLKREEVSRLGLSERDLPFVLGLSSLHPDGRVREAAVRALALSKEGPEIPFLLLRVNDWVAEVRQVARAAVLDRIVPEYAGALLRYLPLVLRLEGCGRDRHHALVRAVQDLLASPEAREALEEGCRCADPRRRRAAFQIAIDARLLSLCHRGIGERDPVVRLRSARLVLSEAAPGELPGLLDRLRWDAFAPVRRVALEVAAERLPEETEALFVEAFLDRSSGIRELAAWHLKRRGRIDPAAFYRARLPALSGRALEAAVLGLRAEGGKEDAAALRALFPRNQPGVQRAVLRALARLDGDHHLDLFAEALVAGSPGPSREACEVLRSRRVWIDRARLERELAGGAPLYCRKNILRVLASLSTFEALPPLLAGTADPAEEVRALAVKLLWGFLESQVRAPGGEELARARKALEEARVRLPAELYRTLLFSTQLAD